MNRRPLVVFTVCWILGIAAAYLYDGLRLVLVAAGIMLVLAVPAALGRLSPKLLLAACLALSAAAVYGSVRDARNVSMMPAALGPAVEGGYAGVELVGEMAGPAKIDGDLAMFELDVDRVEAPRQNDTAVTGISGGESAGTVKLKRTEKVVVRIKLAAEEEQRTAAAWGRGDRLIVSADLETPSQARNFGDFDYRRYLYTKRIHWVARAAGASGVETEKSASGALRILRRNDDLRANLAGRLERLYPGIGAGYMQGLLLGLQDGLDPETYLDFARLGMTHVLAISGMHVGLYVGAVIFLLRRFGVSKESTLLAALCFVPPYVLLTGSSPSAVRAGLMSMIALYAARRGWLKDGLHILCLAALLMTIWDPYYLNAVSFQLSFAVTAGIILLTRPMQRILFFLPKAIAGGAAISLVADLVSFPLTIYYFNQYSLLGLAANLLLVPLISFVSIPLGTVSLILSPLWDRGAEWAAYPVRLLNAAVFRCADGGGSVRWARTIWAAPSPAWIAAYYAALFGGIALLAALLGARRDRAAAAPEAAAELPAAAVSAAAAGGPGGDTVPLEPRSAGRAAPPGGPFPGALRAAPEFTPAVRYGGAPEKRHPALRPLLAASAGLLLCGLLSAAYTPRRNPAGTVQMLDVGQGDSILITTPTGRHILVDGGGTVTFARPGEDWRRRLDPYEVGRDVVVPLLKRRGVHRLDAVILTHGDRDHYGGLLAVLDEIPAERLIMNGTRSGGEDLDELLASALRFGAEISAPQSGDVWRPDSRTSLEFVNPSGVFAGEIPELEEQNDYSVAFRLEMNGHSFMFTGDLGESAERDILERLERRGEEAAVEVLKVGHHGSKTSSSAAWVEALSPKLSLISVGASNTYGHPNEGVVRRLEQSGSDVRRTDLDGEIQIGTPPGEPLRIRTKLRTDEGE
ncbi:ComEC/Rec2 family competence protein [Saccharibacillus sp. CPCC 101409]|uniref:ComEC/Rec2 family competence protein n=1 Tax=Saccharibacillus sp. CPCC 101409 TaxID=3058041 RepID=UPI00267268AB|nr:ComEC/Rec2 family competence protein [Saccharibacillus sp. CPCC 101409]MDO3409138.1 ComEC/Rec2 family competence protein [Saccharibacillus sp. CPCC 101409]